MNRNLWRAAQTKASAVCPATKRAKRVREVEENYQKACKRYVRIGFVFLLCANSEWLACVCVVFARLLVSSFAR